ncbi:MAG: hypothetical protein MUF25_17635 [Pirellulaceae bacterium]|nr:hypothetical protein [Pirellulaceae bacterium]
MEIERIDVGKLDVPKRSADLRRDLHVFVDFVRDRAVKRGHRDNLLGKADAKRLAKLLSYRPSPGEQDEADDYSAWMGFVDDTALQLGFVKYDTEGEYAGYTSSSKSYPENYIEFSAPNYQRFLAMKAAKQEATLLDRLLSQQQGCESEFYALSPLGRLDRFSSRGCATGVMPLLDFAAIRRFLLALLAKCPTGQWLSTASLVRYLKQNHRYFLIPQKPRFKDKWGHREGRYDNFYESKQAWGNDITIGEADEDAFERVEGRYVERFLEGIPLSLGYVDVAYASKTSQTLHPSRGGLKAFRVNDRLRRALDGTIQEPRVTVTPSFDLYVQAESYPAGVLAELGPLCELVSDDTSIVLKLNKQKVAAARAANPKLDVVALLRQRAGAELPANVVRELSEWAQHGEKFVLYGDCCVLEADADVKAADAFTIEQVAPGIRLVHSPGKLFEQLERQELMPLHIKHGESALTQLPKSVRTRFPKKPARQKEPRAAKTPVTLMRVTRIQLVCPNREFLDRLCQLLADAKCPAEADRRNLSLAYSKQHEPSVTNAVKALGSEYQIRIEDAGAS